MGTRSTTKIYNEFKTEDGKIEKEFILAMYRQYDGYIEGMGQELKDFIKKCIVVNGFNKDNEKDGKILCNGTGCFAFQLVKDMKDGTGNLYPTTEDDEQEYNYEIIFRHGNDVLYIYTEIEIKCLEDSSFDQIYKIKDDGVVEKV